MRDIWNSRKNLGTLMAAKLPPAERIPASVARYTSSCFWNVLRSLLARGGFVANLLRENWRAVCDDMAKLIEEKTTPPEDTSGTPENVLWEVLQVILL